MPIRYEIDRARGVILTTCSGETTYADVSGHFRELASDPDVTGRLCVLLDLSEIGAAPDRDQLRAVTSEVKDLRDRVRWESIAIVATSDLTFGMSRVLGIFLEGHFANTGVFRSRAEAERWLAVQLRALGASAE